MLNLNKTAYEYMTRMIQQINNSFPIKIFKMWCLELEYLFHILRKELINLYFCR